MGDRLQSSQPTGVGIRYTRYYSTRWTDWRKETELELFCTGLGFEIYISGKFPVINPQFHCRLIVPQTRMSENGFHRNLWEHFKMKLIQNMANGS